MSVQHALFYTDSADLLTSWGPKCTSRVMPVRSWLTDGAQVAAGTDSAAPFDPMLNLWGFATRETKDGGVQGPEEAIDVATALQLYTLAGATLLGEPAGLERSSLGCSPTWSPIARTRSGFRSTGCRG